MPLRTTTSLAWLHHAYTVSRACGLATESSHLERQQHEENAEHNGVSADQPYQRERTSSRLTHEEDTEHKRSEAAENQQPLTGDLFAQTDRGHDLEHTRGDRPDRNVEQQRERSDTGRQESQDPDGNADQPLEKQYPP